MRKILIGLVCLALSGSMTFAENAKTSSLSKEKAALRAERIRQVGGIIRKEGTGKAVVVNAQKKFPDALVQTALGTFKAALKFNFEVRVGTWQFGDAIPSGSQIAMYIVDDSKLPMSLVASEAKWGVMNVSMLSTEKQFEREFMRVAIAVFGAGISQYKASPMQPVYCPEDLDSLVGATITVDAGLAINANFEKLGFTKPQIASYKKACELGWAPAPTNDIQKTIWDQIKSDKERGPAKPLTIPPPAKK